MPDDPHLQTIRSALNALDAAVPTFELDPARRVLRDAEGLYRDFAAVLDSLRGHIYDLLPEDVAEYTADDGLPPIKRSWVGASSERWERGDDLARLVAARTEDQWHDEDGTVLPAAVIADNVAQAIARAFGFTSSKAWRKEQLRALGIDDRVFHTKGVGGRPSVRWL